MLNRKVSIESINSNIPQFTAIDTLDTNDNDNDRASQNDIFVLNLTINQCKTDLETVRNKIINFQETHKNVCSKCQYEKLKEKFENLNRDLLKIKNDYIVTCEKFKLAEKHTKKIIDENDALLKRVESISVDLTPRPDWTKCAKYFGGEERWNKLIKSLTSNQILDILLNEFIGGNDGTNRLHEFEPLGISSDVPVHLKSRKPIKNIKITEYDLLLIIQDIFAAKINHDHARSLKNLDRENMTNFMFMYFRKRFQSNDLAVEWCYNLIDALERFSHKELPKLFKDILSDNVDESLYYRFNNSVYEFYEIVSELASEESNLTEKSETLYSSSRRSTTYATANISVDNFTIALRKYFESISDDEIKTLINAAQTDLRKHYSLMYNYPFEKQLLNYGKIFVFDDYGNYGEFLKEFKFYLNTQRCRYTKKICKRLISNKNNVPEQKNKRRNTSPTSKPTASKTLDGQANSKPVSLLAVPKVEEIANLKKSKSVKRKKRVRKVVSQFSILTQKLADLSRSNTSLIFEEETSGSLIKVDVFIKAVKQIDPKIPQSEIDRYINWVYKSCKDFEIKEIRLDLLATNLINLDCFIHSEKEKVVIDEDSYLTVSRNTSISSIQSELNEEK